MICNANPLNKIYWRLLMPTVVLCLLLSSASGKNYYFSSTTGNDSYTALQAQDAATPWRTISKLNSVFNTLIAGDSVLFKRGDVFYGSIIINASGLNSKYITLSAYGTGATPVISGFTAISTWSNDGNGIYSSAAISVSKPNMVVINNQPQAMGRYPNESAGAGGYLSYESFTDAPATPSITDDELTSAVNWTGADVVIRKKLWVLDRCRITNHSGSTIYFSNTGASTYGCTENYGYFIQNDIRTLDQFGEWFYDVTTSKLKVYFGTAAPASSVLKIATVDNLVSASNKRFINFNGLAFDGANVYGIDAEESNYIRIQNCSFTNMGETAVYMANTSNILVENCSTYNSLSNAIRLSCDNDSNVVIRNCTIKKTGAVRGMGASGGNSYKSVSVALDRNLLVENNTVDSSGYVAIEFDGSNVLVQKNVVSNFCFNKDDAGGIYSWVPTNGGADAYYTNRVIKNNIVMNGIGAPDGRSSSNAYVSGIYLDGRIMNVDVVDNSVFNIGKNGFHCNNPVNITLTGNTSYNNLNAVSFMRWSGAVISNLVIKNNIFYPKTSNQRNLYYANAALDESGSSTIQQELRRAGTIDSNYHSSSNATGFYYEVYETAGGALVPISPQSFDVWKSYTGFDAASKRPFREAPAYQIRNIISSNAFSNGTFTSNINGITTYGTGTTSAWDNTNKIAGGSLRISFSSPVANRYGLLYSTVGSVSSSKKYVLRFSTLGTSNRGIVRASIRKTASPYTSLTSYQLNSFGTSVKQHEFLFSAPASESNASFLIEIEQNSGTTYIDNVEFYEVDADVYAQDDYLRFEYNATNTDRTVNLGANYFGVDASYYSGTITLKPFTSKILVKDTSIIRAPFTVQISNTNINCFGDSSRVTVTAAGGIPPYTGTGVFTVGGGTYTYVVKDLRGVTITNTLTISQPSAPLRASVNAVPITFFGGLTTINVSATGGTPPYIGTGSYNNIGAGTYSYVITDAKGCTDSVSITLTQPSVFQAFANAVNVKCNGGTGTITVTATGGIPPYIGTGVYTMVAGSYYFKVRDAAGNIATVRISITQPAAPLQATATPGIITSFGSTTNVSVTATGGTAPYTGTGTKTNVAAGTYTYTVTDVNGCTASASVTITQPPQLFTATASAPVIKCYDGTANVTVSASGGAIPYVGTGNYIVNTGKGSLKVSFPLVSADNNTILYNAVGSVSNTKKYSLRFSTLGTTANGIVRAFLRQTNSPWNALTDRQTASFGMSRIDHEFIFIAPVSEASASFVIQLGQGSGTTYIDNIAFFEVDTNNILVSNNLYQYGDFETGIANILAYSGNNNQVLEWDTARKITRTYYFVVTDAAGKYAGTAVATSQPSPLIVNAVAGAVTAGVATVTVTASGGTPPYTGTGTFTNISTGTRTFTVTDANGCSSSKTITIAAARPMPANVSTIPEKEDLQITVVPNPSSSAFYLQLKGGNTEKILVTVFAADGKTVYSTQGNQQYYTFGENFVPGVYIVKVIQNSFVKTIKVVKNR